MDGQALANGLYVWCPDCCDKQIIDWKLGAVLQFDIKKWCDIIYCVECDIFECVHIKPNE